MNGISPRKLGYICLTVCCCTLSEQHRVGSANINCFVVRDRTKSPKKEEKERRKDCHMSPLSNVSVCPVAKACHLTTCRVLAPRNQRERGKTRPRDAPISVDMLGNRLLGCASKFYRTNPAKDTLSAYLLGQAGMPGMLDDTGARYVLSVLLFSGIWNHSLRKSFHPWRHAAEPTKSRPLRRLTTSFE